RHTRFSRDWSSDVCSSDLLLRIGECVIDIRGETRPCERMDEALPGLREAMKPEWRGGVFGTIVAGGVIRVGDAVRFDGWADDAKIGRASCRGRGRCYGTTD